MDKTSRIGRPTRYLLAVFFSLLTLAYLNSAAFHWWLSWGPPSADPGAERFVAARHLVYALAFLAIGIYFVVSARRLRLHPGEILCVGRTGFDEVRRLLEDIGIRVIDTEYHEGPFGSWAMHTSGSPQLRIVWDGKDRWVIIETETGDSFNGQRVWKELWIGRAPAEQTPVHVAKMFARYARH